MSQQSLELEKNIFDDYLPSQIIEIVIQALHKFKNRDDFAFDFSTFGAVYYSLFIRGTLPKKYHGKDKLCVGCLATASIFHIMDEEPTFETIERKHHPRNGYSYDSIVELEDAIDALRHHNYTIFLKRYSRYRPLNLSNREIHEIRELGKLGLFHSLDGADAADSHINDFINQLKPFKNYLEELGI